MGDHIPKPMIITEYQLKDFRNIAEATLALGQGVNVLYGENAQGKTNLIEGITLFSQGRSFRGAKEKELIRFDCEAGMLQLQYETIGRKEPQTLEYHFTNTKRICRQNGANLSRLSELVGKLTTVVFCPKHLLMVSEGPALRRSFLDIGMMPFSPVYIENLKRYKGLLDERNACFKQLGMEVPGASLMFELITTQLIQASAVVARSRVNYLERISQHATHILRDLSGGREELTLRYDGILEEEEYKKVYQRLKQAEWQRGSTLFGCHRDDFEILINGKEARTYASQGQQRSIALALKMAEGELMKDYKGEYPIFLLDDIFSELDERRKQYIMQGIVSASDRRQVILTTCDESIQRLWSNATVYEIDNGRVKRTPGG